jgi:hypothetical protein
MTIGNKTRNERGTGMSLPWAEFISYWSNWLLIGALVVGVIATYGIVVSGSVKEAALKRDLADAGAAAETAKANTIAAQIELEKERQARLELEKKYGPRILTDQEIAPLIAALHAAHIAHIVVLRVDDMEAAITAQKLRDQLVAANINVDIGSLGTLIPPQYGISLYDPHGAHGSFATAFATIAANPPAPQNLTPAVRIYIKPFPM